MSCGPNAESKVATPTDFQIWTFFGLMNRVLSLGSCKRIEPDQVDIAVIAVHVL